MSTSDKFPPQAEVSETITSHNYVSPTARRSERAAGMPHFITRLGAAFRHWFITNTFTPRYFTGSWSHPIFGYLVGVLLQLIVISGILALVRVYPAFRFPEGPLILVILLIALEWGAGPSIIATLVGAALLVYFIFPPFLSVIIAQQEDIIGLLLYLVVGFTVSVLASQVQRARLYAEALSQRLETIIENIPDPLVIYDAEGKSVQFNRVAREVVPEEQQAFLLEEMPQKLRLRSLSGELLPLEVLPLTRALRGETVAGMELVYQSVQGGPHDRVVMVSAAPLLAPQSNVVTGAVTVTRDVSALYNAERLASERAHQLEAIFNVMTDGVIVYDRKGQIIQMNEMSRAFFSRVLRRDVAKLTMEERINQLPLVDEEGNILSLATAPITRILQGETLANEQTVDLMVQPSGEEPTWLNVSGAPLLNAKGQVQGGVMLMRDVTERKRQLEQEHFLSEVSKVLSFTLDYKETLASVAQLVVPKLADWFVVDLVNAEGNFELIEIDHIDSSKVKWARELREKYPIDPHTLTGLPNVVRTGRSELYAHITDEMLVASARDEEELTISRQLNIKSMMLVPLLARGQTIGVVTFVSAESSRKYTAHDVAIAEEVGRRAGIALDNARLYQEVQQARDQLEIILQGVADGIVVYDQASRVIYANEAAASMNGFASVQEMLGTSSQDVVALYEVMDEHGQPINSSQLTHKRVFAGEKEAQAIIGSRDKARKRPEHWSLLKSRPVFDDQGHVIFAITIIHDITESVLTERRKDEFISMASHELKTPVTSLKGFTHVLQRRLAKQGDEQGQQYLARMDAQLTRLTNLINDLLDISKMQSGQLSLHEEAFDLDALVQETVENVQATTTTHQLLIEGKTEAQIWGDKDRLGQVYINLLTNAIKYSPDANKVIICLSREGDEAIISVQDFGLGIDASHHQKIFERFYQVTDPEEKTFPGLGIGLFISSEIVERHHGRLWLKSSKGEGSTFYVALPLLKKA